MCSTNKKQPFSNQKPIGTDTVAVPPGYCTVETFLWSEMESSQSDTARFQQELQSERFDTLRQKANLGDKKGKTKPVFWCLEDVMLSVLCSLG